MTNFSDIHPTQFPEIDALLARMLQSVRQILGDQFYGFYLYGSLACGDFNHKSDIDFLIVTSEKLSAGTLAELKKMHKDIAADLKWGYELEGSYIPVTAIRYYDPNNSIHPHIERGGQLKVEKHDSDWIIQRHILREMGVVIEGPLLKELIEPVGPDQLRQAVLDLRWWWARQLYDARLIKESAYQAYAILSMCRILYTLSLGVIVSKPVAARWAQDQLDARWVNLIERGLTWEPDEDLDLLKETTSFIRFTLNETKQFELLINQKLLAEPL